MLFRTLSAAVYGIDADLVDIEVDLTHSRGDADQSSSVPTAGLLTPPSASRANAFARRCKTAVTSFRFKKPPSISPPLTWARKARVSIFRSRLQSLVRMAILQSITA